MDIKLETNIEEVAGELRRKAEGIAANEKKAMSNAVRSLFVTSKNALTRLVYNKEIPRRPRSGKPRWRRSYSLLKAERFRVSTKGEVGEVFTDPQSRAGKPIKNYPGGYGQKRHNKDGRYTKAAPWRQQAYDKGLTRAVDRYRESIMRDLD